MKFGYSFKTSDGVRHEDTMVAKKKEDVFADLRERHIKAIKVWEIRSRWAVSKRTLIIIILTLSLAATCYLLRQSFLRTPAVKIVERTVDYRNAQPLPRKQIRGLPSDLSRVLPSEADVYLANFAQPGRLVPKSVAERASDEVFADALRICLTNPVHYVANEPAAHAEVKCIVEGLKQEIRTFCNTGRPIAKAVGYLADRQRMEYEHRESLKAQVASGKLTLEVANADCRAMGLAPIEK